jgi:glycosyltransferase involved in cell wall biosynthesis
MRVLLDHSFPFLLGHGGLQIQIEQTFDALRRAEVNVEHCRWWDDTQKADIIHYFGRPSIAYVDLAQRKGIRVVMAQLLTGLGSRAAWLLPIQKTTISLARRVMPGIVTSHFAWDAYQKVDAAIALTGWEAHLMGYIFDAPRERVHVVPNGVEETFFQSQKATRGQWLVCTATITERKRVLELAEAAVLANIPLWIIGKPYAESDRYAQRFLSLAQANSQLLRYEGAIADRAHLARIYREARGFVLLSTMESLSLSALEAAACECPLLLSDLPWAKTTFKEHARYCPVTTPSRTARFLREFYSEAPNLKSPPPPPRWMDVARQFKAIYEKLLQS